jgi:hypothetical protein
MAELLFIQPQEISNTTILGGNVDIDKYSYSILNTQIMVIEPLLGTELYNKIISDIENDTLAGDYLDLYTNYIKPITKYQATAEYIEVSSYMLTNGGIFKHSPENSQIVEKDETQFLAQKYSALAQGYILRFNKWICKHNLPEYKVFQDEVNATRNMKLTGGWKL